ncbi:MAG: fumarylacetoacetate hydrolase family protein [Burkholderiaceae bacterium]|nr:fumarylacetoacetate hydrolase family protein [Burkholderiaceae bacterium]
MATLTPQELLRHIDRGERWSGDASGGGAVTAAYQIALAVRALRIARGERPRGFKIGFTNSQIWPRYQVFAPIWGTVWDSTLHACNAGGEGRLSLASTCQPRIEPEAVFGLRTTPAANATLDDLFDAIEWVAPGFEVVQSHQSDWKFQAADTVADSGLHARLLVGTRVPVRSFAANAAQLDTALAGATVVLEKAGAAVERGSGADVLGSPLRALQHFLAELRQCPGAPDLVAGDVVTTGTWTDAWPVAPGEQWRAHFDAPLSPIAVTFS